MIIPAPPGYAVAIQRPLTRRFAPLGIENLFAVGLFDRGTTAQINGPGALEAHFGGRVAYSNAYDELLSQLAEGGRVITIARVTGPNAVAASISLDDDNDDPSVTFTAGSVGEWGNQLRLQVVDVEDDGGVRLVITENDAPVAASPAALTVTDLAAWETELGTVTITGAELPAVAGSAPLTGGTDDRAGITTADWAAALTKLDARYGPGVLRTIGSNSVGVHLAAIDHCEATGRVLMLDQPSDVTEGDAMEHSLTLESERPDSAWRATLWASWTRATVITGEPDRLVPWSALQAGIHARVMRELGVGNPAFGPRRGASRIATRLHREFTTGHNPPGEVQRLYAQHVNAAVDRGSTIHAEGYRTLDRDPRREDAHVAVTLMWLQWKGAELALQYIGEPVDQQTLANYHQDIAALCEFLLSRRALVDVGGDRGYIVDVEGVNDVDTMARRELHGFARIRPTGSVHWVDLLVGTSAINEPVGV